jgi:hypothetical protein
MKNRIKLKNKKAINIAVIAVSSALAAAAVLSVVFYRESTLGGAIISAAIMLGLGAALVFSAFFAFYAFDEKNLKLTFGFLTQKIPYERMLALKEDDANGELYLSYMKNDEVFVIKILVPPNKNSEFVAAVRQKNPFVIYELFDKNRDFEE